MGNEASEPWIDDQNYNFERVVDSGSQNPYIGYSSDDIIRIAVDKLFWLSEIVHMTRF